MNKSTFAKEKGVNQILVYYPCLSFVHPWYFLEILNQNRVLGVTFIYYNHYKSLPLYILRVTTYLYEIIAHGVRVVFSRIVG